LGPIERVAGFPRLTYQATEEYWFWANPSERLHRTDNLEFNRYPTIPDRLKPPYLHVHRVEYSSSSTTKTTSKHKVSRSSITILRFVRRFPKPIALGVGN
jgi:hypothetical protein